MYIDTREQSAEWPDTKNGNQKIGAVTKVRVWIKERCLKRGAKRQI